MPRDYLPEHYTGSSITLRHTLVTKISSFIKHFSNNLCGVFFFFWYILDIIMVVLIIQKGTILKQRESKELAKLKQANGWIKTSKLQCCVLPFPTLGEEITSVMLKDRASLVVQTVKNLPAVQEIQVQSLSRKDPLEKGMATHSVFLPGESHGQRNLAGYSPWGRRVEIYT